MSDRVKLRIMGISYNPIQNGAFALLLAEENGPYRIPVVIGAAEAQSIAIKMEGVVPPRPMTHDLFCSFAHAFGVQLTEVYIYKFEDGIFSSQLTFTDGRRTIELDARTSDAIAIAIRTGAPIYTTRQIVEETGTILEEKDIAADSTDSDNAPTASSEDTHIKMPPYERLAVEELERTLEQLIADENYEEAGKVSAILNRKRNSSNDAAQNP